MQPVRQNLPVVVQAEKAQADPRQEEDAQLRGVPDEIFEPDVAENAHEDPHARVRLPLRPVWEVLNDGFQSKNAHAHSYRDPPVQL